MKAVGDCYFVAGQFIMNTTNKKDLLVHGEVTGQGKIEGLKGEMKAMQAQIDLLRSKMSYEKAQTTN